jgi:hypothetical protein
MGFAGWVRRLRSMYTLRRREMMTPESTIKESIVRDLSSRGLLEPWESRQGAPLAELDLGVAGFSYHERSGVLLDEWALAASPRRLSELLDCQTTGASGTYLHRAETLTDLWRREGYDPVLYRACRNLFAPRPVATGDGAASCWYADLVEYRPGVLPNGEFFRSTGHWNPSRQIEIFQALFGEVAILLAGYTSQGEPYLLEEVCGPGDFCIAPPGAWHITYVLSGPAVVFNIYTERGVADRDVQDWLKHKYVWRKPVRLGLLQGPEGRRLALSGPESREWQRAWEAPKPALLRDLSAGLFPAGRSLAATYLFSSAQELSRLQDTLWRRWWPDAG